MPDSLSPIEVLSTKICPWLNDPLHMLDTIRRDGKFSHGWILAGPAGVGKINLALVVARRLLSQSIELPGHLDSATALAAMDARHEPYDHHQDLHWIFPDEGKYQIAVGKPPNPLPNTIRALIYDLNLTSHTSNNKVAIIEPAEAMNGSAMNALLKTLEEPTPDTYILLVSHQPTLLPATIRSRCQILPLSAPPREEALPWLSSGGQETESNCADYLSFVGGAPLAHTRENISKIIKINNELKNIFNVNYISKMNPYEIAAKFKDDQALVLEWLTAGLEVAIRERFRGVGLSGSGREGASWLPAGWEKITKKSLFNQLDTIRKLRKQIDAGVKINTDLGLGLVLQDFLPTRAERII